MGEAVRVTVIAAGFDGPAEGSTRPRGGLGLSDAADIFGDSRSEVDLDLGDDDDFDVPSFLR